MSKNMEYAVTRKENAASNTPIYMGRGSNIPQKDIKSSCSIICSLTNKQGSIKAKNKADSAKNKGTYNLLQ